MSPELTPLRASGYGKIASVQILGTPESIRIADRRITVGFLARRVSPRGAGGRGAVSLPGRHSWHYA